MKKVILGTLTLIISLCTAYGQKINYEKSLSEATKKATQQNKLLLLIINTPTSKNDIASADNQGTGTALDDAGVINFYNKNFVTYIAPVNDPSFITLRFKYGVSSAYLFIDKNGNLIYKETGNLTSAEKYMDMGQRALVVKSSGKTLSNMEAQYLSGNRTAESIREYITTRMNLGKYDKTNAKLLDDYVDHLKGNLFQDYNDEVPFILKAGPFVYGKAYNFCLSHRRIFDSVFTYEPFGMRMAIHNRIVANTLHEATDSRDEKMAQQAIHYAREFLKLSPREADIKMFTEYYMYAKDTAAIYRKGADYIDRYYSDTSKVPLLEGIKTAHPVNPKAAALSFMARVFYNFGTTDKNYRTKAMLWSKKAIELEPRYGYYDTLAHLLYQNGLYNEALTAETKAIAMAETEVEAGKKPIINGLNYNLNRIKNHTLKP